MVDPKKLGLQVDLQGVLCYVTSTGQLAPYDPEVGIPFSGFIGEPETIVFGIDPQLETIVFQESTVIDEFDGKPLIEVSSDFSQEETFESTEEEKPFPTIAEIEAMDWRHIKGLCTLYGFDSRPETSSWSEYLIFSLYGEIVNE